MRKILSGMRRAIQDYNMIEAGDKIAQSIFLPYGVTLKDKATGKRNGGFGSTTK